MYYYIKAKRDNTYRTYGENGQMIFDGNTKAWKTEAGARKGFAKVYNRFASWDLQLVARDLVNGEFVETIILESKGA